MRFLIAILLPALLGAVSTAAAPGTAAELRGLSDAEARKGLPVNLRGVVTFASRSSGDLYIQDATGGFAVKPETVRSLSDVPAPGTLVEVSGVTDEGLFAPVLAGGAQGLRLVNLGMGVWPEPEPLAAADLESGLFDARRVAVHGVLRTARNDGPDLRLELATRAARITVIVPGQAGRSGEGLLHARVRAVGVLRAIVNSRRQWVGNLLLVPRLEDLQVESPPADPFALPESRVTELARMAAPDTGLVRLRGLVTYHGPDARIELRTPEGSLQVHTLLGWKGRFAPGDVIEVAGYPVLVRKRVVLHDAVCRSVGREPPPAPVEVTAQQALSEDRNGELIAMSGRLVQVASRAGFPLLLVDAGGYFVEAACAVRSGSPDHDRLAALPVGAMLRLTGIAAIEGAMQLDGTVSANSLALTLRSAEDVAVLVPPPFWTTTRLLGAVGLLAAAAALFAAWSASLRRRVSQQTAIIRENIKREAVWEERSRIAQDIHDDVGAALTQISLLGEIGRREGATPETMTRQLGRVVAKARDAVRALDEIVWTVNPVNDSLEKASSYLCQVAQDLLRDTPIRCRLLVAEELPARSLGAKVRHHLFLAVKEALNNAIKHSGANELHFSLHYEAGRLLVVVEDDGRGFDPAAADRTRNGLTNMERRLADIGGTVRLASAPGRGTRIEFAVAV